MENDWNDDLRCHIWVNNANQERLLCKEKVSKMFVFFYLGFKVPVAFYVSYRRKASSRQEWKALMTNFAWEDTSFCDWQRGLAWEQRLKTATGIIKALSQKTATFAVGICVALDLALSLFHATLKSVISYGKCCGKIFSWKPDKAIYGMKELLWLEFIEQLVFSDLSSSSFPPTFFFLPLFWYSDT